MIIAIALLLTSAAVTPAEVDYSLTAALVRGCDRIDDEYMDYIKNPADKRRAILRTIAGKIGPIEYVNESYEKMANKGPKKGSSGFGTILENSAAKRGPKTFPPEGKYVTRTPKDFTKKVGEWMAGMKRGEASAIRELASVAFCEAIAGKGTINERKIAELYKKASDQGDAEATFMLAVCAYYGIGCKVNKPKAYELLGKWKNLANVSKAMKDNWVHRRFAEMKK